MGTWGGDDGEFKFPQGIAVDRSGNVYVADRGNDRVQKFDSRGNFLTKWGSQGSGDGQFNFPFGVGVSASGNIFVVDTSNHRIQVFKVEVP